jgi:prepilin-type N-terminal cleavage/methylation domain-containing protein
MRNLRNSKGFTLIELMIVVVIIGILAAIAIPKFSNVSKSSKEAEADGILKQAYTLQENYRQKNDKYAVSDDSLKTVGWSTDHGAKYYTFTVKSATDTTQFCIQANPNTEGSKAGLAYKAIQKERKVLSAASAAPCS